MDNISNLFEKIVDDVNLLENEKKIPKKKNTLTLKFLIIQVILKTNY